MRDVRNNELPKRGNPSPRRQRAERQSRAILSYFFDKKNKEGLLTDEQWKAINTAERIADGFVQDSNGEWRRGEGAFAPDGRPLTNEELQEARNRAALAKFLELAPECRAEVESRFPNWSLVVPLSPPLLRVAQLDEERRAVNSFLRDLDIPSHIKSQMYDAERGVWNGPGTGWPRGPDGRRLSSEEVEIRSTMAKLDKLATYLPSIADTLDRVVRSGRSHLALTRALEEQSEIKKVLNAQFDLGRITLEDEHAVLAAGDNALQEAMKKYGIVELNGFRGPFALQAANSAMKNKLREMHPGLADEITRIGHSYDP